MKTAKQRRPFATGTILRRIDKLPLKRLQKDVLGTMARKADWDSGVVPASLNKIAAAAQLDRCTVSRTRAALTRYGLLAVNWRGPKIVQYRLADVLASDESIARFTIQSGAGDCSTSKALVCSTNKQITGTSHSEVRRKAARASVARRQEKAQPWLSPLQRQAMGVCRDYHPLSPADRRTILGVYLRLRLDDECWPKLRV